MAETKDTILENKEPIVQQPTNLEMEVKEIKAQNEYLLNVIQKMDKHMNCEGLL